jgi:CheY-like chemotaxis protein
MSGQPHPLLRTTTRQISGPSVCDRRLRRGIVLGMRAGDSSATAARARGVHGASQCLTPMATSLPAGVLHVALAHRDAVSRAALRTALHDRHGIAVVGEAATDEELVALVTHVRLDVVILDVRLPSTGCMAATLQAHVTSRAAVLLLSGGEPDPRVLAALRAGAAGVIPTDSEPSDLVRALTLLGRGWSLRPRHARRSRGAASLMAKGW